MAVLGAVLAGNSLVAVLGAVLVGNNLPVVPAAVLVAVEILHSASWLPLQNPAPAAKEEDLDHKPP